MTRSILLASTAAALVLTLAVAAPVAAAPAAASAQTPSVAGLPYDARRGVFTFAAGLDASLPAVVQVTTLGQSRGPRSEGDPKPSQGGSGVIIDAANYVTYARNMWTALAREQDARLLFVEVVCTDLEVHQARLDARPEVPGLPRVRFEDVVVRFAETEAWGNEPRWLVNNVGDLDLDAVHAEVLAALDALSRP